MELTEIGMLTHSEIVCGLEPHIPASELDEWQRKATAWTIRLCSDLSAEHYGPGNWPAFHFWKGEAHGGTPPTVSDLVYSVASDSNYLESEPEEISYQVGKKIEHNEQKMRRLFGHQMWERIKAYDEDEMQAAFGAFS